MILGFSQVSAAMMMSGLQASKRWVHYPFFPASDWQLILSGFPFCHVGGLFEGDEVSFGSILSSSDGIVSILLLDSGAGVSE